MAAFLVMSVVGGIGAVSANHTNTDVYVGNASEMGINDTHTIYENPQNAFKNLSDNTTVAFQNGTYELNNSLETNATGVNITAFSGNVTLDGTNTTSGNVFINNTSSNLSISENITISNEVMAGGGSGQTINTSGIINKLSSPGDMLLGIPVWVIYFAVIILGLGAIDYYKENN